MAVHFNKLFALAIIVAWIAVACGPGSAPTPTASPRAGAATATVPLALPSPTPTAAPKPTVALTPTPERLSAAPVGKVVVATFSFGNETQDPPLSRLGTGDGHMYAQHQRLLTRDPSGQTVPAILTLWEAKENGQRWEFVFRKGLKFHNGEDVTIESVKRGAERAAELGATPATWKALVKSIEIVGDDHIAFSLSRPDFFPLRIRGVTPLAVKYYTQVGEETYQKSPMGAGPFKLSRYVPGDRYEFEAYDGFYDSERKPTYKTLVMLQVAEAFTRLAMLKTGEADLADKLDGKFIPQVQSDPRLKLISGGGVVYHPVGTSYYWKGFEDSPTKDLRVRQAISLAIDRESIVKNVMFGVGGVVATHQMLFPYTPGYDAGRPRLEYNPDKARQLLKDAGYPTGITIDFWYIAGEQDDVYLAVAEYLRAVGFNPKIRPVEKGAFYSGYIARKIGDLHAQSVTGYSFDDPVTGVYTWAGSTSVYSNYNNPEIDALLGQGQVLMEMEKRGEVMRKVETLALRELTSIPVVMSTSMFAAGPRVASWQPAQGNPFLDFLETVKLK